MKFLLLFTAMCFIAVYAEGQKNTNPSGLYSGSIDWPGDNSEYKATEIWDLKKDHSFIYMVIDKNRIKKSGFGKWTQKNGNIEFLFHDSKGMLPLNNKIEYKASSGFSADSIYVKGRILFEDSTTLCFPKGTPNNYSLTGILNFDNNINLFVDRNGLFSIKAKKGAITKITGYFFAGLNERAYRSNFILSPDYNFNEINITLIRSDSVTISSEDLNHKETRSIAKKTNRGYLANDGLYPSQQIKSAIIKLIEDQISEQYINKSYLLYLLDYMKGK